jgi:hypothetical protein
MSNANQILERIKGVRQFQPSVIRNSLLVAIVQIVSLVGAVLLIALSIFKITLIYPIKPSMMSDIDALTRFNLRITEESNLLIAYYLLFGAVLLLLIWRLTKMVINRNAYIMELNEVLDGEEK